MFSKELRNLARPKNAPGKAIGVVFKQPRGLYFHLFQYRYPMRGQVYIPALALVINSILYSSSDSFSQVETSNNRFGLAANHDYSVLAAKTQLFIYLGAHQPSHYVTKCGSFSDA